MAVLDDDSGNKLILVITDAFTRYTDLVPLLNKEASTVARAFFDRWICRFSVPTVIISDRGMEFLNSVMQDLTKWLGASHDKTSPYHLHVPPRPKLPFFDIHNPRPLYKDGFVPDTTARLGTCLLYTSPSPRD